MLQVVLAITGASLLAAEFLLYALTGREGLTMVGFAAVALALLFLAYEAD
jgi:hypothetical protein